MVFISLVSLASGSRGRVVSDAVRTVVGVVSLPFLLGLDRVEEAYSYTSGLLTNYSAARQSTETMAAEVARLQQRVASVGELQSENYRLRRMLDFERAHPEFTLLPAEVIQHARGILTIDRGAAHGMRESMCVVSPSGVIGIVTQVGPLTANVATLQSNDCKIDAMIKWNRVRGRVYGSGNEMSGLCNMHYIDLTDQVREGDEVVTSPDSVFPPGYPIGRVVGAPKRGQLSQSVTVQPTADPFRVDEVFVLLSASLDWRDVARPRAATAANEPDPGLVDIATVQERLAP